LWANHTNTTTEPWKQYYYANLSGNQWMVYWSYLDMSDWFETFKTSCEYGKICVSNNLYIRNTLCQYTFIKTCGAWGCNDEGTACNLPVDPITGEVYEEYGSYCIDDYTYVTISETGESYDTCIYPEQCFQQTSNTIKCLSPTALESFETNITGASASAVAKFFGIDVALGMPIWALFLCMVLSAGGTIWIGKNIELGPSAGQLFLILMVVFVTSFTFAQLIEPWVAIVIVFALILMLIQMMFKPFHLGGK